MPDTKAIAERLMNEPIHKWIASILVTACLGLVAVIGSNLMEGQRETNKALAEIRESLPVMRYQIAQQDQQIKELKDMLRQEGYRMPYRMPRDMPDDLPERHGWIYRQPGILSDEQTG